VTADGRSDAWDKENDPFGENFFLLPREEETWARAEQIADDNRDALRHHVELLVWETQSNQDLLKNVVSVLWHFEEIDCRWIAEACFMSVGDVRDLAESQPIMAFHCLDCGAHLQARNRQHLIWMYHSLRALRRGEIDDERLGHLLCKRCSKQRVDHADARRRLDDLRRQALHAEYRRKAYSERRQTQEWAILALHQKSL
jgi:hypothetical protein